MSKTLRIVFAGTPDFAAQALQAVLAAEHPVCAVYTQPDRPSGRGRKLTKSPVKLLAEEQNIPVLQPPTLRDTTVQQVLYDLQADVMVVVAYGLILPRAVLQAPRLGCINIHASLLPRWRGAAPIQRAILAGDHETGITIIQMDEGLDTGAMLLRRPLAITSDETGFSLHDRLALLGGEAIIEVLSGLAQGGLTAEPQDNAQSCYAAKLNKAEAHLDWQQPAIELARQCRAFNPWPVAFTELEDGRRLRIWSAEVLDAVLVNDNRVDSERAADNDTNPAVLRTPGTVLAVSQAGIDVATGAGVLRLLQLQLPGGRSQAVKTFVNAATIKPGVLLGQRQDPRDGGAAAEQPGRLDQ